MDEAENAIDPNWQCADQLHDPAYPAGPDAWLATFAKVRARSGGQGVRRTCSKNARFPGVFKPAREISSHIRSHILRSDIQTAAIRYGQLS